MRWLCCHLACPQQHASSLLESALDFTALPTRPFPSLVFTIYFVLTLLLSLVVLSIKSRHWPEVTCFRSCFCTQNGWCKSQSNFKISHIFSFQQNVSCKISVEIDVYISPAWQPLCRFTYAHMHTYGGVINPSPIILASCNGRAALSWLLSLAFECLLYGLYLRDSDSAASPQNSTPSLLTSTDTSSVAMKYVSLK